MGERAFLRQRTDDVIVSAAYLLTENRQVEQKSGMWPNKWGAERKKMNARWLWHNILPNVLNVLKPLEQIFAGVVLMCPLVVGSGKCMHEHFVQYAKPLHNIWPRGPAVVNVNPGVISTLPCSCLNICCRSAGGQGFHKELPQGSEILESVKEMIYKR